VGGRCEGCWGGRLGAGGPGMSTCFFCHAGAECDAGGASLL